MTIEVIKQEAAKLSRVEKLQVLQYLAELLSDEERTDTLSAAQGQIIERRRREVIEGKVTPTPADLLPPSHDCKSYDGYDH